MKIELENFIIESDDEILYKDEIINLLKNETNSILDFFELEKLSKKIKIVIYNSVDKYRNHMEKYVDEYKDWMIGDTYGSNINLLSLDVARKTKSHSNLTLEGFLKGILHEFVHSCQREYGKSKKELLWFWEALAVNLSGQNNKSILLKECNFDDLKSKFNDVEGNYKYAYELGKYMLKNLSNEKILAYIKNPVLLENDENKIFNDAVDYQSK